MRKKRLGARRAPFRLAALNVMTTLMGSLSLALAVARGYRALFPFQTIYVADLDGIEGRGANSRLVQSSAAALPDVEFWIDAGLREPLPGMLTVKTTVWWRHVGQPERSHTMITFLHPGLN